MRLSDIQKNFKNKITAPEKENQEFSELFEAGDISLEDRFSVYQNNVLKSLADVIVATYPLIEILTGKDFLRGMARDFIKNNLPEKGNINDYGGGFADFIKDFEVAKGLPYLSDIARMEWAVNEVYYAPDDTAIDMKKLQGVAEKDFERLSFSLRKSCRFITSDYPLYEIRDFCLEESRVGHLNIDSGASNLLIFRPELDVEIFEITDNELHFLQNIAKGQKIEHAIETIDADEPNVNLTEILQKHLSLGTFSSFKIRD